ncbi:MAG: hypothetical protein JW713_05790 [Pontiellaceae bacterium]|nr:hypothetical protein [Pontiellaceae bacterium]
MKKILVAGCVVVVLGLVLLVAKRGGQGTGDAESGLATNNAKEHQKEGSVDSVSSSAAGALTQPETQQSVDDGNRLYVPEQLSEPVKALLGLDGEEHNYNSLGNAIGKLSKELSVDDVAALREMLTWPNDRFPEGMRDIEINAIKNDVLDRLLRQNTLPEGIGLQLVEIASNPENDPVWRDYCVQFMTPFYEQCSAESMAQGAGSAEQSNQSALSEGELDVVRKAMFGALDERDSTIAGTSLIGLELLSRTHEEFDREAIVNSALEIASDESASAASRMTALRLSVKVGTTEDTEYTESTAETARLLAQTGETVLLRSAAIVTLGEIGIEADRELLESFANDENQQIASAAKLAMKKMDAPDIPRVDLTVPQAVDESASTQPEPKLPPVLIN